MLMPFLRAKVPQYAGLCAGAKAPIPERGAFPRKQSQFANFLKASHLSGRAARLPGVAVLFRIQQFGEAGVFLKKGKVFIVTGMKTVGGAESDGDFEVRHGGIGLAREAIEGREGVVDMVGLGRKLAGFFEAFAGLVPTAEVHHGDATLVMLFGRLGILLGGGFHALLDDAQMSTRAVRKLLARTLEDLFELLLGALELLLVEQAHRVFVKFHLRLDAGIDEFDAAALRGRGR